MSCSFVCNNCIRMSFSFVIYLSTLMALLTGFQSYSVSIGKALKGCEQLRLEPFQSIICTLPNVTNNQDLSTDQRYLFDTFEAINLRSCADNLLKKNPGKTGYSKVAHDS
nr:unnamed protein product [Callosobruchus analis]